MRILTVIVAFAITILFIGLLPVNGEAEIYDSVIRLHVLANSDNDEDQELKLCVRDSVLEYAAELTGGCRNISAARAILEPRLDDLASVAEKRILEEGYSYPVSVVLSEEIYPTRSYESFCFPSGEYLSLQVKIGAAEGKNWWCVLFPPLCMSAASASEEANSEAAFIDLGFTSEQYRIITDSENTTYKVRFKILETVEDMLY